MKKQNLIIVKGVLFIIQIFIILELFSYSGNTMYPIYHKWEIVMKDRLAYFILLLLSFVFIISALIAEDRRKNVYINIFLLLSFVVEMIFWYKPLMYMFS